MTTIKLGFGPYLEKEPPSANFELRGVVHPTCGKAPRGKCVGEVKKGGQFLGVPLPANGVYSLSLHLPGLHPQTLKATFTLALSC